MSAQFFSDRPPTRAEHEAWVRDMQQSGERQEFIILENEGGKPIGTAGLSRIDLVAKTAEYGIMIGDLDFHKGLYALETGVLMLDYAFQRLELHDIHVQMFSGHAPALAVCKVLGFVEDPSGASERLKNGIVRKTMRLHLSRPAWR